MDTQPRAALASGKAAAPAPAVVAASTPSTVRTTPTRRPNENTPRLLQDHHRPAHHHPQEKQNQHEPTNTPLKQRPTSVTVDVDKGGDIHRDQFEPRPVSAPSASPLYVTGRGLRATRARGGMGALGGQLRKKTDRYDHPQHLRPDDRLGYPQNPSWRTSSDDPNEDRPRPQFDPNRTPYKPSLASKSRAVQLIAKHQAAAPDPPEIKRTTEPMGLYSAQEEGPPILRRLSGTRPITAIAHEASLIDMLPGFHTPPISPRSGPNSPAAGSASTSGGLLPASVLDEVRYKVAGGSGDRRMSKKERDEEKIASAMTMSRMLDMLETDVDIVPPPQVYQSTRTNSTISASHSSIGGGTRPSTPRNTPGHAFPKQTDRPSGKSGDVMLPNSVQPMPVNAPPLTPKLGSRMLANSPPVSVNARKAVRGVLLLPDEYEIESSPPGSINEPCSGKSTSSLLANSPPLTSKQVRASRGVLLSSDDDEVQPTESRRAEDDPFNESKRD